MYALGVTCKLKHFCVIALNDCFRRHAHIPLLTYLLTYLSLPNACLCKVLAFLAVRAGRVFLVSQALPAGEVGCKFMSLHYYCEHVELMHIFRCLLLLFFCVPEY